MEFAFHTRLDGLDTCRALSRASAGVARNARKARRGMLLLRAVVRGLPGLLCLRGRAR